MFILLKIDLGDTFLSLSPVIIDDGDFYEKIFNIYSVFSGFAQRRLYLPSAYGNAQIYTSVPARG